MSALVGGDDRLRVLVGAGKLRIEGEERTTDVSVTGKVCGGAAAELRLERGTDGLTLRVGRADSLQGGERPPRVDLVLRVPSGLAVEAWQRAGQADVRGTGPLRFAQGPGRLTVRDVIGEVRIRDGGGPLYVDDVIGDVAIADGGDAIFVRRVSGSVTVVDGAGGIYAKDVDGDVIVLRDGEGAVEVERVGGEFDVVEKTADRHLVRSHGVGGSVRPPSDRVPP